MSKINIDSVRDSFKKTVSASLSLTNDAQRFKEPRGMSNKYFILTKPKQYSVVELSFLRLYTSWEEFIEQAFVRYMCGATTSTGYSPKRYVQPLNLRHAFNICTQGRAYADWMRLDEVIQKSKLYFEDGEPFKNALGSAATALDEMKTIRNRITHGSEHSNKEFRQVVMNRIGVSQKNMVPGRFLLIISTKNGLSLFEEYANTLLAICDLVVH